MHDADTGTPAGLRREFVSLRAIPENCAPATAAPSLDALQSVVVTNQEIRA
ncbi:hypothetical protein [Pandoraea pulmonicola]|uniref:hypothetical protein n=1 Tax=Pandoraea pulmonicola TaxID=93221 RepID=UPI0012F4F3AB|nr:hypothetical protein [Pandoraea pulmonicola]